jgi:hypothetical protein
MMRRDNPLLFSLIFKVMCKKKQQKSIDKLQELRHESFLVTAAEVAAIMTEIQISPPRS